MSLRRSRMGRTPLIAVVMAVVGLTGCTSTPEEKLGVNPTAAPSASLPLPTTVELVLGHCWIEYLELDGRTWAVTKADQFGAGDSESMRPDRFKSTGEVTQVGDTELLYVDDAGAKLTLVSPGDSRAFKIGGKACA